MAQITFVQLQKLVFFDKCVTANFKNLRKYAGLAILINL